MAAVLGDHGFKFDDHFVFQPLVADHHVVGKLLRLVHLVEPQAGSNGIFHPKIKAVLDSCGFLLGCADSCHFAAVDDGVSAEGRHLFEHDDLFAGFGGLVSGELLLRGLDGRDDIGDRFGRVTLERGDIPLADGAVVLVHAAALRCHLVLGLGLIGNGICLFTGNGRDLLCLLSRHERDVLNLLAEVIEKCHSTFSFQTVSSGLLLTV